MSRQPLISVVMPVYNGARYLREALESVLSQSFGDFELIAIDDGSTDRTPEILEEFARRDKRLQVGHQPHNTGLVEALTIGLRKSTGKYIARMDGDDVSLPERFEQQVAALESSPELGVLGTQAQVIDGSGGRLEVTHMPTEHAQIHWAMCFYNPMIHPAIMMRRDLCIQAGGYAEGYPNAEDFDLWRRLLKRARLGNLPQTLLLLRKHQTNITITASRANLPASIRVGRDILSDLLNREVPLDVVEVLWNPDVTGAQQIAEAADLIEELYGCAHAGHTELHEQIHFIRQDVARRLMLLALRRKSLDVLAIFWRAVSYSPGAILDLAAQILLKKTAKVELR